MAEEFSRTTARKRVLLPGAGGTGGSSRYVDVPIITKISFIDPYDRYQEYQYSVDNSSESTRAVHIDEVHPVEDGVEDTGQTLLVERVDEWPVVDPYDRYQETRVEFDNVTKSEDLPPSFISHFKRHVFRYTNPDTADWIDAEVIDEFHVVDPYDRYQEKQFTLNNKDVQADPDDPEISDTDNGIDPAWRTDPFQNIINFNGANQTCGWSLLGDYPPSAAVDQAIFDTYGFYTLGMTDPNQYIRGWLKLGPEGQAPQAGIFYAAVRRGDADPPLAYENEPSIALSHMYPLEHYYISLHGGYVNDHSKIWFWQCPSNPTA